MNDLGLDKHQRFLQQAISIATENVNRGGGPYGAVIVKAGAVIAGSGNRVTDNLDPTAHAEVMTIRLACQALGDFQLDGCILYSSCEPCPMCLGAITGRAWTRSILRQTVLMRRMPDLMTALFITSWINRHYSDASVCSN